ncbi:MAG: undecaprenyldiphospho-muramoylpentapeptide beta-N-acetylglucosaminyltransferase [Deltaproteobacteria bacterium]|nr:undecaprenyldiphospho-muramoylpentapeptide beta-N-acetylglucosaminyltransferase [Deltaproteobacteria bacterium]
MMIKKLMVAGGGTGGHLFPGIAVVEELRRRLSDVQVVFVGTENGIEARLLPQMGEKLVFIQVRPLLGRTPQQLVNNLSVLPRSLIQAIAILRKHKPDVVLGLGGYAAGPILLAASVLRIPTALLEQNAQLGLTNRLLAPTVGRAYLSYPETAAHFGLRRSLVCGNPVRRAFVEAARIAAVDPAGLEARARYVLVTAGSQGARTLNQIIPRAFARAGFAERGIAVLHQTGSGMLDAVKRSYCDAGIEAEVKPFIDDMARAYSAACLVIARSGATTLAEMCAIGRPSILIPYPHHSDDHQGKNAVALERAGAAIVMREERLTIEGFAEQLNRLLDDRDRRYAMAERARLKGRPEAAASVVDDLCAWLGHPEANATEADAPAAEEAPDCDSDSPPPGTAQRNRVAAHRRPKVRRCQLRLQTVNYSVDAAG